MKSNQSNSDDRSLKNRVKSVFQNNFPISIYVSLTFGSNLVELFLIAVVLGVL